MTKKKDDKLVKLLESADVEMINGRFRVKFSSFDNGVDKKSHMLAVHDILENKFKIHFYDTIDDLVVVLKLLKMS